MTDTKPAPKDIRIGAKVTLGGTVIGCIETSVFIRLPNGVEWWLSASDFLTVENPPEELKVGDRVRLRGNHRAVGRIFGVDDSQYAVRWDTGLSDIYHVDHIERLPS